ncbi:hypothetical protein QBC39DRAFT_55584 [Podospora conica]|nr:hypothetical protein QBC39DRAFT_55584 [Schizothecium conicum]
MQFSVSLLALAASFAMALPSAEPVAAPEEHTIQKRGCHSSGVTWGGEKAYAYEMAFQACKRLVGTFVKNEVRYECRDLSNKKKADFSLVYIGSAQSRNIDLAECYDGMAKEIGGCDRGGATSYSNWHYSADPNDGQCF